jgi:hypothetical protein
LSADSVYGSYFSGLGDDEMMDMPAATYQKIKQETYHGHCKYDNSNLWYDFYKTPLGLWRFAAAVSLPAVSLLGQFAAAVLLLIFF